MKFSNSCPITYEKIDENVIRLQAGIISILGILYIFSMNSFILGILFYDFLVRILGYKKISPSVILATFFANRLSLSKRVVDAGPKKFAANIGLVFISTATLLHLLNYVQLSVYTVVILTFFASLESLFCLCVACKIYPLWRKIVYSE